MSAPPAKRSAKSGSLQAVPEHREDALAEGQESEPEAIRDGAGPRVRTCVGRCEESILVDRVRRGQGTHEAARVAANAGRLAKG